LQTTVAVVDTPKTLTNPTYTLQAIATI